VALAGDWPGATGDRRVDGLSEYIDIKGRVKSSRTTGRRTSPRYYTPSENGEPVDETASSSSQPNNGYYAEVAKVRDRSMLLTGRLLCFESRYIRYSQSECQWAGPEGLGCFFKLATRRPQAQVSFHPYPLPRPYPLPAHPGPVPDHGRWCDVDRRVRGGWQLLLQRH
jgi:hypothetical protein